MDWLRELVMGSGVAHAIFIYALVIALGVILGKQKVFGVSLGPTFVLFMGILAGHLGLAVDPNIIKFIQEFGLILFIFSIGLQVGPGFFSSFKEGGMVLNGLAVLIIALNIAVALAIYYSVGDIRITDLVGVLSGAVTNTPGLGAAQQTLIETRGADATLLNEAMSMGYAAAYPLGVVGIILSLIVVKALFKINAEAESKSIEDEVAQSQLAPHLVSYRVTNKLIFGRDLRRLHAIIDHNFVVSRMKRASDGEVIIPKSDTEVNEGDLLLIVMSAQDQEVFDAIIGEHVDMDWKHLPAQLVSQRILVTNSEMSGRKLGSLRLRMGFRLNATRVNRAGVDLLASPNLSLQVGDRITVVGNLEDINRLAEKLGNSMKTLDQPNIFTMFIGIVMGILVGSIPLMLPGMTVPMKLGLAGGPLIVAILLGRYGYKLKLVTYTSSSANLMLRELGICLFLASVGIAAGGDFARTVFNAQGLRWVLYGFLITIIPLLIVGPLARGKFHINYCTLMGMMAGATTDPPALAYANKTAGNDAPAVAYSTVYPLTMFLRVITAQLIIMILA
ncbi:MAG: putative transporter [Muribaculaceae bacterium]|nr:putative transporter [Muribaculaceae bacterium]